MYAHEVKLTLGASNIVCVKHPVKQLAMHESSMMYISVHKYVVCMCAYTVFIQL